MRRFEYKSEKPWGIDISALNAMGREGWEIVVMGSNTYIFKRELGQDEPPFKTASILDTNPMAGTSFIGPSGAVKAPERSEGGE